MVSKRLLITSVAALFYALACRFILKPLLSPISDISDIIMWALGITIALSIPKETNPEQEKPGNGGVFVFIMVWITAFTMLSQI